MKLLAVIFDLDGTIIKSEEVWGRAFVNVLKTLGVTTEITHPQTAGISLSENWKNLILKYNIKTEKTPGELEALTYIEYEKLILTVTLNDNVLEFMETLKEGEIPLALATSTKWETTDRILTRFELTDLFENITTGEEIVNPKPSPDIYFAVSDKLGIDPGNCLVIEDSEPGVIAAKEAGMRVIAVSNDEINQEKLEEADLVVDGFSEITPKVIEEL